MKIAVLADIHANLEALTAVLHDLDACAVDEVWCLGDIVGYGADPEACLALIRGRCALVVAGNHDTTAASLAGLEHYNPLAGTAIRWTHARLATPDRNWLARLPLRAVREGCVLFHGSLARRHDYIDSARMAGLCVELLKAQYEDCPLGLHGHTHVKSLADDRGGFECFSGPRRLELDRSRHWLVNPGAVGQPRDNNPLASYGLLDTATLVLEIRTVAYDIEAARRKIRAAGLPGQLADRLASGT